MNWKRTFAYVTGSVDEELLARNEYLVTENRILRGQIKNRIRLTVVSTNSKEAIFMPLFGGMMLSSTLIVVVQKAAEPLAAAHRTFGRELRKFRPDNFVLESLVVSFLMIVFNELKNRL